MISVDKAVEKKEDSSSAAFVPICNWRAHWLTADEFARVLGRSHWTVQRWLREGTLTEFGIPIMQFRHGRRHSSRTFIRNIF